jgi:cysteine-rich repeat protein
MLASGALACGRTTLAGRGPAATGGQSGTTMATDAAPSMDTAHPSDAVPSAPDLAPDLRNPNCGNGWVDPGEECDDGNTLPGDGCDPSCMIECDWSNCPWPPTTRPVVCGDGILGPGEECDDRNLDAGDGCSPFCTVEPGFRCVVPGRRCTPICGDGMVVGMETCDDGNSVSGDGCSEFCLTEDCWDCSSGVCRPRPPVVDGGNCHGLPVAGCGDGKLQGAEECDDGAANNDSNYGGCSTHCRYLTCGDGIVNGPEQCDLGFARNTTVYGDRTGCTRDCTVPRYCGDGVVDGDFGEQCDMGAVPIPRGKQAHFWGGCCHGHRAIPGPNFGGQIGHHSGLGGSA